jgi:hypothetical protein
MKCKYCGRETVGGYRLCPACHNDFSKMRIEIWNYHDKKYGKLTAENLKIRQQETKKLTNLWKKNPEKLYEIIGGTK